MSQELKWIVFPEEKQKNELCLVLQLKGRSHLPIYKYKIKISNTYSLTVTGNKATKP